MRFRLPTLFLLITLVAVTIGWYLDHHRRRSDEIVGVWHYPTLDHPFRKGIETLTCCGDGTFTLQQSTIATYSGTYSLDGNGIVLFRVTSKQIAWSGEPLETHDVDKTYRCRIARDSYSHLIVVDLDPERASPDSVPGPLGVVKVELPETVDIFWHCYTSMNREEQNEQRAVLLMEWAGGAAPGEEKRER